MTCMINHMQLIISLYTTGTYIQAGTHKHSTIKVMHNAAQNYATPPNTHPPAI